MRARRFCAHAGSCRTAKSPQIPLGPANITANIGGCVRMPASVANLGRRQRFEKALHTLPFLSADLPTGSSQTTQRNGKIASSRKSPDPAVSTHKNPPTAPVEPSQAARVNPIRIVAGGAAAVSDQEGREGPTIPTARESTGFACLPTCRPTRPTPDEVNGVRILGGQLQLPLGGGTTWRTDLRAARAIGFCPPPSRPTSHSNSRAGLLSPRSTRASRRSRIRRKQFARS